MDVDNDNFYGENSGWFKCFFYLFSPYVYLVQLFWVGVCVRTWVCVCESEKNGSKSSFIRLQRKTNTKFVFCHLIMNIFSTPFYSKRIIEILCTFQIPLCILICAIKLLGVFYSLILTVTYVLVPEISLYFYILIFCFVYGTIIIMNDTVTNHCLRVFRLNGYRVKMF